MSEQIDADTIAENAAKPQSASGDGESVSQFSISEQIVGDKYKNAQSAQNNPASGWPMRFGTIKPPGTE